MKVWDDWGNATANLTTIHGWAIEKTVLMNTLGKSLSQMDVDLISTGGVTGIQTEPDTVQLKLENHNDIKAKLLIGADGANSRVRKFSKIPNTVWPYDKISIEFLIKVERNL